MRKRIASYDMDGVINMGDYPGVRPGPDDVIITGRSFEEMAETYKFLDIVNIHNIIFFNPLKFSEKTRESSGLHKADIITKFNSVPDALFEIVIHFEDDPIQAAIIRERCPNIKVVELVHELVEKENVRHII